MNPSCARIIDALSRAKTSASRALRRTRHHAPLVGLRCALSVKMIPPFVAFSAAATFTRTPAAHGATVLYVDGTSNAAARVVVACARPREVGTAVGVANMRWANIVVCGDMCGWWARATRFQKRVEDVRTRGILNDFRRRTTRCVGRVMK